ncbi:GIY-YIG nuclease family protein [Bradyrhizobium cenepequi]
MRERILDEIKRLTKEGGTPPGVIAFKRETGIQEHDWRGVYWARWGDALTEAGFAPNEWQGKHNTELVLAKFIQACRHYSRIPTSAELQMYARGFEDFPNAKSLFSHFGSKDALLEHLRAWVTDKAEFADVADMLGSGKAKTPSSNQKEGLVYLIKSGAHYKIGRSDELERRVKEIRISLPEAATLVHSIRTDDPVGIEAYWHRRFGEKRANGEWFKLTSADVAAFKRRKFQ